jgi:SAM-dependent methyltransferase
MTFGIDRRRIIDSLKAFPSYLRDLHTLKSQKSTSAKEFPLGTLFPCLHDRSPESGAAKGHYFHQDLLIARRIYLNNPITHVDVGSRVDGFIAHVASFRHINVLDIRQQYATIPNITFIQADFMEPIQYNLVDYSDSLSCLHALEHFGLGRYGDPINYDGYMIGLNNLLRIVKTNGKFYFSVPIGPQRIEFNAHRVFSVAYLLEYIDGKYHIDQFSFVDDMGDLHENVPITHTDVKRNFGCVLGCGIFEMTKV